MSRDEVDRAIVGLVAAYDRISAAMFVLDGHPSLTVVRGGGLRGETQKVAVVILGRVDMLWSHFAALGTQLERARAVRAERSRPGDTELRTLTHLLHAASIGLAADDTVVEDPGAGVPVRRISLPDLVSGLERVTGETVTALERLDAAGNRIAAAFGPATAALDRARAAALALGGDISTAGLEALARQLTVAQAEALGDPLGWTGTVEIDPLLAEIRLLSARTAEIVALRDTFPERVRLLRGAADEIAAAEAAAAEVYAVADEKIANHGLPALPDAAPPLRAHLAQLEHLHQEGRWSRLVTELSNVDKTVAAARERAAYLYEAADGLLRRRIELRGRLDAYRSKAGRMGLAEHAELADRHRAARDLLYSSPCDLPAATRAVMAYQRYLNDLTERGRT